MWTYQGAGGLPEVPGVPARDLSDAEYAAHAARIGASLLHGVYVEAATDQPEIETWEA